MARLVLPKSPWTVEVLLNAYVTQVRGRRLILSRDPDVVSPEGPSGMWFPTSEIDLVWAHPAAEGVQLDHILGHELGHMVNDDQPDQLDLTSAVRLLMGACNFTSPGLWRSALAAAGVQCRADGTSTDARERKAEAFGYYAESYIARMGPRRAPLMVTNLRESLDI
jgi:hypothetical protein